MCHMTQQFHFCAYSQKNPKQGLASILTKTKNEKKKKKTNHHHQKNRRMKQLSNYEWVKI